MAGSSEEVRIGIDGYEVLVIRSVLISERVLYGAWVRANDHRGTMRHSDGFWYRRVKREREPEIVREAFTMVTEFEEDRHPVTHDLIEAG